jgi:VCBS repeat-containing protein
MTLFILNPCLSALKKVGLLCAFLIVSTTIHAQIQVQTTAKESRCSANGQIIVKATGGTLPYSYQLLGSTRPPQTNDTFNLLQPAVYTIRVTDNSGASRDVSVTVTGNYQAPAIQCTVSQSTVTLTPTGGRAPLRYAYSPFAPGTFTTPQSSNIFECVPNGTHTFRIYDSCDNFFSIPCTVNMERLKNTTTCKQVNGKTTLTTTAFSGGEPPYLFTCITSNNDTFRNTTGNFANLSGCQITLFFSDRCSRIIQFFDCSDMNATVNRCHRWCAALSF